MIFLQIFCTVPFCELLSQQVSDLIGLFKSLKSPTQYVEVRFVVLLGRALMWFEPPYTKKSVTQSFIFEIPRRVSARVCRPAFSFGRFSYPPRSLASISHALHNLGARCKHKTPMCSIIMFFSALSHIISPFWFSTAPANRSTQGVTILKRRFPDDSPSFFVSGYANGVVMRCCMRYHAVDA